ncbi:hypothetical protein [Amycolatopsis sp. NPDC051071]|uniref:hypothetical protein n=1 Tax=Amycolatopsis sp. NPDC051071 TaxID=3154637 RepID=UPI00342F4124
MTFRQRIGASLGVLAVAVTLSLTSGGSASAADLDLDVNTGNILNANVTTQVTGNSVSVNVH